jgi:hypothetical protein
MTSSVRAVMKDMLTRAKGGDNLHHAVVYDREGLAQRQVVVMLRRRSFSTTTVVFAFS